MRLAVGYAATGARVAGGYENAYTERRGILKGLAHRADDRVAPGETANSLELRPAPTDG